MPSEHLLCAKDMTPLSHLDYPTKWRPLFQFAAEETEAHKGRTMTTRPLGRARIPDKMSLSFHHPQGSSWDPGFKRLTCMTFTQSSKIFI